MAQIKVSQLSEDISPTSDDYILAVDNATHASKKVTMSNLVQKAGGLATVAVTGVYSDLVGKPTIPSATGVNTGDQALSLAGTTLSLSGGGGSVSLPTPSTTSLATAIAINQIAHGLSVGQLVYFNATYYALASAASAATAEVIGMVSSVPSPDAFVLAVEGRVTGLSGLTAGSVYFLSPITPGNITTTEPSSTGQVDKPVFVADSTTSGFFHNYRGLIIGTSTGGGGSTGGGVTGTTTLTIRDSATSTAMVNADDVINLTAGGTLSLQNSATATAKRYTIKNSSISISATITAVTGQSIDGSPSITLPYTTSIDLIPDGSNWLIT
jgi:hypothetical protein